MVLLKNESGDWRAWLLTLFVALCGALCLLGIESIQTQLKDIDHKLALASEKNAAQDVCLTGIMKDLENHMRYGPPKETK